MVWDARCGPSEGARQRAGGPDGLTRVLCVDVYIDVCGDVCCVSRSVCQSILDRIASEFTFNQDSLKQIP